MSRGLHAFIMGLAVALAAVSAHAQPVHDLAKRDAAQKTITDKLGARATGVCPMLDSIAKQAGLPPLFFARLIWQESRFRANAVSPKGAQGIAQFMPGTADLRGLADPFEPKSALVASAAFLADLRAEFGNLGLAAAAYNAGPQRVRDWLAGERHVPPDGNPPICGDHHRAAPGGLASRERCRRRYPARTSKPGLFCLRAIGPSAGTRCARARHRDGAVRAVGRANRRKFLESQDNREVPPRSGSGSAQSSADRKPIIRRERNLSIGRRAIYQARLGAHTRQEAATGCAATGSARLAGQKCIVRCGIERTSK